MDNIFIIFRCYIFTYLLFFLIKDHYCYAWCFLAWPDSFPESNYTPRGLIWLSEEQGDTKNIVLPSHFPPWSAGRAGGHTAWPGEAAGGCETGCTREVPELHRGSKCSQSIKIPVTSSAVLTWWMSRNGREWTNGTLKEGAESRSETSREGSQSVTPFSQSVLLSKSEILRMQNTAQFRNAKVDL